jgi:hypothetical protein
MSIGKEIKQFIPIKKTVQMLAIFTTQIVN